MKDIVERMLEEHGVKLSLVDGKKVRLTSDEKKAVKRVGLKEGTKLKKVYRRSDREFDLKFEGTETFTMQKGENPIICNFSAWLPLYAIREFLLWTHQDVAVLSDYANMVYNGDWSGIRDSSPEAIWTIFDQFGRDALFGKGKLYQPPR